MKNKADFYLFFFPIRKTFCNKIKKIKFFKPAITLTLCSPGPKKQHYTFTAVCYVGSSAILAIM